jgi:hypothetical protein
MSQYFDYFSSALAYSVERPAVRRRLIMRLHKRTM